MENSPVNIELLVNYCRLLSLTEIAGNHGLPVPALAPTGAEIELPWDVSANNKIRF